MTIDPSQYSSVLAIPTNQLINNPFSQTAFATIHTAMLGFPTLSDLNAAALDPNVDPILLAGLKANLGSLNTITAGGSLASMDGIVGQMTSQVVPSINAISTVPAALFSAPGMPAVTSSMAQSIGVPNAMSMLSAAQSNQSLANQMLGNKPGSTQQCGILADINGVIKSAESAIAGLYGAVSAGINALEHSISATVTQFANAVRAALPTVTIDPNTGLQVTVPGSPIASSVLTQIAQSVQSAYNTIKSAMSTVINAIDAAAVSIENQMKLGIASVMAKLNADPCFAALARSMTGPTLSTILAVV